MRNFLIAGLLTFSSASLVFADFSFSGTTEYDPVNAADRVTTTNGGKGTCSPAPSGAGATVDSKVWKGTPLNMQASSVGSAAQCTVTRHCKQEWNAPSAPLSCTVYGSITSTASATCAYQCTGFIGANTYLYATPTYQNPPSTSYGNSAYFGMSNGNSKSWSYSATGNPTWAYSIPLPLQEHQNPYWDGVAYDVVVWSKAQASCGTSSQNTYTASSLITHTTGILSNND